MVPRRPATCSPTHLPTCPAPRPHTDVGLHWEWLHFTDSGGAYCSSSSSSSSCSRCRPWSSCCTPPRPTLRPASSRPRCTAPTPSSPRSSSSARCCSRCSSPPWPSSATSSSSAPLRTCSGGGVMAPPCSRALCSRGGRTASSRTTGAPARTRAAQSRARCAASSPRCVCGSTSTTCAPRPGPRQPTPPTSARSSTRPRR